MNNKLHVLVINSDSENRNTLRTELDHLNVECTTHTSDEGIYSLERGDYDGIILDGKKSTCIKVSRSLLETNKNIPVVVYAGNGRQFPNCQKMDEQGFWIMKPNKLQNSLKTFIDLINYRKTLKEAV